MEAAEAPKAFRSTSSLDFYDILEKDVSTKNKSLIEVYPSFKVTKSKDLMVRGGKFYAIWDAEKGLWLTDEYEVQRLVDRDIQAYEVQGQSLEISRKTMLNFSSNSWLTFRNYVSKIENNYHQLDDTLTFKNTEVKKEDYVTKRLPYDLSEGSIDAWEEVVSTLYDPDERRKIEWLIGSIVAGDSKTIQKFVIFYSPP